MARWLVHLQGDRFDLEEFPHWFPDGDIFAIDDGAECYLVGPAFEKLADANMVREAGLQVLDEFSAIISLLWPGFMRPTTGNIIREEDDGTRRSYVFLSGTAAGRSKAQATLSVGDDPQAKRGPTQAQILLAGSRTDDHLRTAISLWADPLRTWPRLYRILEEVERYLTQPVSKAGWCSDNQRERFTRSANAAEVAGQDARHATGKVAPPKAPMALVEATQFIGMSLQAALRDAAQP